MTETYKINLPYEITKIKETLEEGETNYARFIQDNFDALRKSVELYGMRSIMPYAWDVNFDSVYSAELYFWMPTKTDSINSCKVKVIGSNYRGYSGDVTVGGSGTTNGPSPTSSGAGGTGNTGAGGTGNTGGGTSHSHGASSQSTGGSGADVAGYSYGVGADVGGMSGGATVGDHGSHSHVSGTYAAASHEHASGTYACASHTHSYNDRSGAESSHTHSMQSHTHSLNSHTHTLNSHTHGIGNHDHGFTLAIKEGTDPTGVNVYIDDGAGYGSSLASGNSPVNIEIDVSSSLSTAVGWKKVKVTSTRVGRASITLILDCNVLRI